MCTAMPCLLTLKPLPLSPGYQLYLTVPAHQCGTSQGELSATLCLQ